MLLTSFPAITNAQEMKPETLSERLAKIQPAQTQQISGARKGEVSEAASVNLPVWCCHEILLHGFSREMSNENDPYDLSTAPRKYGYKLGIVRRHPIVFVLAASVAVGLTIALVQRRGHCPGEYTSGDPPCPPPDKNFKH